MLDIYTSVCRGVIVMNLEGCLNKDTYLDLENNINYLLYKQKMYYFVINFKNVSYMDNTIFHLLQNKLVEIFLSCGKVILCGLKNSTLKKYCCRENIIVDDYREAINYFY